VILNYVLREKQMQKETKSGHTKKEEKINNVQGHWSDKINIVIRC